MNIDIKKLNPWNWFKHEDESASLSLSYQVRALLIMK